jgi:hypothetical protein
VKQRLVGKPIEIALGQASARRGVERSFCHLRQSTSSFVSREKSNPASESSAPADR